MRLTGGGWTQGEGYRKKVLADASHLGKGAVAQVVTIKAGEKVGPHYHERATEFYYILEGEADLDISGEGDRAVPGDAYLVRPGDVHSVTNDSEEDFKLIVFKRGWDEGDLFWL